MVKFEKNSWCYWEIDIYNSPTEYKQKFIDTLKL